MKTQSCVEKIKCKYSFLHLGHQYTYEFLPNLSEDSLLDTGPENGAYSVQ